MFDLRRKKVGILVRISDDREGRELGVSRQEDDCRRLAERAGGSVYHVYVENSISASAIAGKQRDDFEDFLEDWRLGKFDVPVAYTTSRLTRDNTVAEQIIAIARQCGVSPCFVASPWCDLSTAAGRRMYRQLAVSDTAESEDIQERIKRKKLQDAREGRSKGGRRLYGYGKVIGQHPSTGKDICDPYRVRDEEVAVLREGMERTLAGQGQFVILKDWLRRGVTTSLGHEWMVGPLKRTLLNPSYVQFDPTGHPTDCPCLLNPETGGTRCHYNDRHRAKWPAIFSQAEHDAMRAIFDSRPSSWTNTGRVRARSYLLSGILFCGGSWKAGTDKAGQLCGGYMYGQSKGVPGDYKRRYACKKWERDGSQCGCGTVFRMADPVEQFVTQQVLARFASPAVAKALAPSHNEERMREVVQELADLQTRRERLAAEYAAGEHDKDDYRVMMKTIKTKLEEAEAEQRRLMSEQARSLAVPLDGGLSELWETASMEWQASVIKLIVEKVVILPGRSGGKLWPDKNGVRFDPSKVVIHWSF